MNSTLSVLLLSDQTSYCYTLRNLLIDRFGFRMHYVRTDSEAESYLKGAGVYRNRMQYPLPDLFLLDTMHPDAADLRMLAWIREQPALAALPLVILVDRYDSSFLQKALDIGANSFLVQRDELGGLEEIMGSVLEAKWLREGAQSPLFGEE